MAQLRRITLAIFLGSSIGFGDRDAQQVQRDAQWLRETANRCTFAASSMFASYRHLDSSANLLSESQLRVSSCTQPLDVHTSEYLPESNAMQSGWKIWRIGPLQGYGGSDWSFVKYTNLLVPQRKVHLVAASVMTVDSNGHVIGYPPVHNHHSHIYVQGVDKSNPNWWRSPILLNHQDSACSPSSGGDGCFLYSFPPEFSIQVDESLDFSAAYNDVRQERQSPLQYWVEIAMAFDSRARKPVELWSVYRYATYAGEPPPYFNTFQIPSFEDSAVWMEVRHRTSGRLLNLWMHTHITGGFKEAWFVAASLRTLGLETDIFQLPACGVFVPARHNLFLKDLKQHIEQHMTANSINVECIASVPRDFNGQHGDRQPHWNCSNATIYIRQGTEMSAIAFFSPSMELPSAPVEQHFHFQGYIYTGLNRTFVRTIDAEREFSTTLFSVKSGMPYGKGCSLPLPSYIDGSRTITRANNPKGFVGLGLVTLVLWCAFFILIHHNQAIML